MPCLLKDQPLRVRFTPKGVVHAASYRRYGGFSYYHCASKRFKNIPEHEVVQIACRWREPKEDLSKFLVSNKEKITCKACIKRMGMDDGPESPERYVIRRKSDGKFMKNTYSRCSGWSDSITDAFFFRKRYTAVGKCRNPDMEVRRVKIILE